MGWILFVLSLSVITTQCTVIKNAELAHKRVARSPCEDCDDWPPPPPGPPRPRYLHPYPRYLDYPPPLPPPPPPPFYYPHLPPPPPPPPPPFRHHWHKVINDSDERDDDEDYNDSASAVSGVTGQNSGQTFSMASAGINGGGDQKYSRYGSHYSSGSETATKGGQLSQESFESQTGSGSGAQSNSNAQSISNNQAINTGALSAAGSSATSSSQILTSSNSLSRQGGAQSAASSNAQSIQTGSKSSETSNVQSSLNHNSLTSSGSQAQVGGQSSLTSTIPESNGAAGIFGGQSLNVQSSGLNQQSSKNFGGSSSEGLDIQPSAFGSHSFGSSNLHSASDSGSSVSSSQSSSVTASTDSSNNNVGHFIGSNVKPSSFSGSSNNEFNAQFATGKGSKAAANSNSQSSQLGGQSSIGLNVQSSKNVGSSSAESQSSSFGKKDSSGSNAAFSNNGDFVDRYPTGYGINSANSKAESSNSHHTSGKFDKASSNNFGGSAFESFNTQSSDNGFENQSPVNFTPLYSDNFNDSPSVSSSSESVVGLRPFVNTDNQSSINLGGSSLESSNSQIIGQKPLANFNRHSSNSFGSFPSEGSNIQSSSSESSSTSSKPSSNNFASSSFKSSHTYHNTFGGQSNEFNSQPIEIVRSSEESTSQPIGNGPINIYNKSFGGSIQPDKFIHKPSSVFDGQSGNAFSNNFGSSNTQSQSSQLGDQTTNFDTPNSNYFGSSSSEQNAFQPSGVQHFESSSQISTKNSNSKSSSFNHKFSTSYNQQSLSNGGSSFTHSNTEFGLDDQTAGVNGQSTKNLGVSSSRATNAPLGGLNNDGYLDQSSENISGSSSKGSGQFSTESVIQSHKNLNDLHTEGVEIHPHDRSDEISTNFGSQSDNSFESSGGERGDIPPSDSQTNIPLSGPTGIGNRGISAQETKELRSHLYEYHKGGNAGSIDNVQQSASSENFGPGVDNSGTATDLAGLTASGLRKSLSKLKGFGSEDTGYSSDSSLEKPKTDSSYFGGQTSDNYNGHSINNFEGSGFSEFQKESLDNIGSVSSSKAQSSSNTRPYFTPRIQPTNVDSGSSANEKSSAQSSTGHKKSNSFDVNPSSTNTQSSSSSGSWSSQDSSIHSFAMGDEMCVCGPRKSALFTAISKSGAFNGFAGQSAGSAGELSSGYEIQNSGGSLGKVAGAPSTNNQIKNRETHYSSQNGDRNVAGYDVEFDNPNLGNGNRKDQIDSSEITASSDVNNNNGLKSDSNHGPELLPNPSIPPSRLLLPPIGPPPKSNLPARLPGANPSSVIENIGNNDQRKEDFESQQYEYQGDNNPALNTDQQQTSDFGSFGTSYRGGSSGKGSDFTSSDPKGGNGFGIPASTSGARNFGTGSSAIGSYYTSSNSKSDGFGAHGLINEHGFPSGYVSGDFDTQASFNPGPQGPQTRSENGDRTMP